VIDYIFFVAFSIFSFISLFLLFSISRKVKKKAYYAKILFAKVLSILLLQVLSTVFLFLYNSLFILFVGFIVDLTLNLLFLIRGASQCLKDENIIKVKIEDMQKEIEVLKEKPNLELEKEKALFDLPSKWLTSMIENFVEPYSFENKVVPYIFKSLEEIFDVDGSAFFISDIFDDSLTCKVYMGSFPPPYKLPDDMPHKEDLVKVNFKHYECNMGESLFGKVAQSGTPYYISSYQDDGIVFQNGDEDFLKIGSIIAFPLFTNGNVSGVYALSRSFKKPPFSEEDFKNISSLTPYFSAILSFVIIFRDHNEMMLLENTSNMSQEFRQLLLPKKLNSKAGLDMDFYFRKQHGVCSDYYDIISHKDRTFVILLDVAGKSMKAVIVMIMIRAILYLVTNTKESLDSILDWLNKGITGKLGIDHFAVLSLLCYHPKTHKMDVIVAGNHSMLLYRKKTKEVEVIHHKTDPIGVDINSKYKSITYDLYEGDIVSLYTDGISAMLNKDGKFFNINNLAKVIAKKHSDNAKNIISACRNLIDNFSEGTSLSDDQTLLVIKRK